MSTDSKQATRKRGSTEAEKEEDDTQLRRPVLETEVLPNRETADDIKTERRGA